MNAEQNQLIAQVMERLSKRIYDKEYASTPSAVIRLISEAIDEEVEELRVSSAGAGNGEPGAIEQTNEAIAMLERMALAEPGTFQRFRKWLDSWKPDTSAQPAADLSQDVRDEGVFHITQEEWSAAQARIAELEAALSAEVAERDYLRSLLPREAQP